MCVQNNLLRRRREAGTTLVAVKTGHKTDRAKTEEKTMQGNSCHR